MASESALSVPFESVYIFWASFIARMPVPCIILEAIAITSVGLVAPLMASMALLIAAVMAANSDVSCAAPLLVVERDNSLTKPIALVLILRRAC